VEQERPGRTPHRAKLQRIVDLTITRINMTSMNMLKHGNKY
jgi:hypothetical protein